MSVPIVMCWSGGKDSAMALWKLQQDPQYEVKALMTTITEGYERISMHGVRRTLLQQQAESIGLPLDEVLIPIKATNEQYEAAMEKQLRKYLKQGIKTFAFGDLFLEDIRAYREKQCARLDLTSYFPIWQWDTADLARTFIEEGFKTYLVCVDPKQLDPRFCGRLYDGGLLAEFPAKVDPCGEYGEFHTFVFEGPLFQQPIAVERGEVVEREGFWFCDLR